MSYKNKLELIAIFLALQEYRLKQEDKPLRSLMILF